MTDRTIIVPQALYGDPARFRINRRSYSLDADGDLIISIIRAGRDDQVVSVDWALDGITGTPSSGTLTFSVGESSRTLSTTVGSNAETGVIRLSNPTYVSGDVTVDPILSSPLAADIEVLGAPPEPPVPPPDTSGYINGWAMQGGYQKSQQDLNLGPSGWYRGINAQKDFLIYQWLFQSDARKAAELDYLNWFATNAPGCNLCMYVVCEAAKNPTGTPYKHHSDMIDAEQPNWWLYDTLGRRCEASFNPSYLWKANESDQTPNNASGQSFAEAYQELWFNLLDAAPYKRTDKIRGFFHDVAPPFPQRTTVDDGATATNIDFSRDGTSNSRYSNDPVDGGGTLLRNGLGEWPAAFQSYWGTDKVYWGNLTRYGLEMAARNFDDVVISDMGTYKKFHGGILENIGNVINLIKTGTPGGGYSNTGSGNPAPKQFFARMDYIRELCVDDADNPLGRTTVLTDWKDMNPPVDTNTGERHVDDIQALRTVGGCCALIGGMLGANGGGPAPPLDEFVYDWGNTIDGQRPYMVTADYTTPFVNGVSDYTMRAPDYENGTADFHWQEFENVLWVLRSDWFPQGTSTYGTGTAVSCELPDPGAGNKWVHADLRSYTNPNTGRSTMNQDPSLNDGSDVNTGGLYGTVSLKQAHAVMLVRQPSVVSAKNAPGLLHTSASNRQRDPTNPAYGMPRMAYFNIFQPRDLWENSTGRRSTWAADYESMHDDWPYCLHMLHQGPFHNTPGVRLDRNQKAGPINDWAQRTTNIDRRDAALQAGAYSHTDFRTNQQTSTTVPTKQAGWTPLLTHPETQAQLARIACDAMAGSDESGYNMSNGASTNVARFMVYMHDGTSLMLPKSGASLRSNFGTGTINSIVSSNSQQPIEVRLNQDYSIPTFGTLSGSVGYNGVDPTSYGACSDGNTDPDEVKFVAHVLWFLAPGNRGFMGVQVIGYKSVGGDAQLFCKQLSSIANGTQFHTPAAGWNYVLNNQNSGTGVSGDWDYDGNKEDWRNVESVVAANGLASYWDQIGTLVNQYEPEVDVGIRVANCISANHVVKRAEGLHTPHAHQELWDFPHNENAEGNFEFGPIENGSASELRIGCNVPRATRVERGMRSIYFGLKHVRPNPGGFANKWARGMIISVEVPGSRSYVLSDNRTVANHASFARWYWAVTRICQGSDYNIPFNVQTEVDTPKVIEESFIDLDTGWANPLPMGDYDEAGGAIGSSGYSYGLWSWRSGQTGDLTDNGRRIYIRKLSSEWIVIVNMADAPSGYDYYEASHLSGGFTPRDPQDYIEPADWTALIAAGWLSSGVTLYRFDPNTYVNNRVTTDIRRRRTAWASFSVGPRQDVPFDSNNGAWSYTMRNSPCVVRDNFMNNGSVFDRTQRFGLGPLEALLLRIG